MTPRADTGLETRLSKTHNFWIDTVPLTCYLKVPNCLFVSLKWTLNRIYHLQQSGIEKREVWCMPFVVKPAWSLGYILLTWPRVFKETLAQSLIVHNPDVQAFMEVSEYQNMQYTSANARCCPCTSEADTHHAKGNGLEALDKLP